MDKTISLQALFTRLCVIACAIINIFKPIACAITSLFLLNSNICLYYNVPCKKI